VIIDNTKPMDGDYGPAVDTTGIDPATLDPNFGLRNDSKEVTGASPGAPGDSKEGGTGVIGTATTDPNWKNGGPGGNTTNGGDFGLPTAGDAVDGAAPPADPNSDIALYEGGVPGADASFLAALTAAGLGEEQSPVNDASWVGDEPGALGKLWNSAKEKIDSLFKPGSGSTPDAGTGSQGRPLDPGGVPKNPKPGTVYFSDPDATDPFDLGDSGVAGELAKTDDLLGLGDTLDFADVGIDTSLLDTVFGANADKIGDLLGSFNDDPVGATTAFEKMLADMGVDMLDPGLTTAGMLADLFAQMGESLAGTTPYVQPVTAYVANDIKLFDLTA
jgi:hypothetical protein